MIDVEIIETGKENISQKDEAVHKKFLEELSVRIQKLEVIDKKEFFIKCRIEYGFDAWSKDDFFSFSKKSVKMSDRQDIKFSVMIANVSAFLNNNSGKFDKCQNFLRDNKVCISLYCTNSKSEEIPAPKRNSKTMKEDKEESKPILLNAEKPRFRMSGLIVNDSVKNELVDTVKLIKNRDKIYHTWGFSEIDSVPHCVINMYGPPGTGKTMSAHILADELGVNILALNYADIESKYVGDAPKNLVAAFDFAQEHNALLFFDEADSFLGKRITNVSQSSDQAVNSLRSQLLILLETRDMIVVFATNLQENYDTAFNSRILKHIKFELPDVNARKRIIQKMIPSKVPLAEDARQDSFFEKLAELTDGFSPREIKNAVLNTLINASEYEAEISAQLFYEVFEREKKVHDDIKAKEGKRKKELGEKVKKSLDEKDYNVVKRENNEAEYNNNDFQTADKRAADENK